MPKRIPRLQVIIDYRDLTKLLEAAEMVDDMQKQMRRLDDKLEALRRIQSETIEKVGQIERDL